MIKKDYFFEYGGLNSNEFGLQIKDWNYLDAPEKNIEEVEVLGKNGSLFIDHGNYKNRIIDITCLVDLRGRNKNEVANKMNEWLLLDASYKKLKISDDEEHYFEAICINKLSFTEILGDFFEIIISFSAKPFKKNNRENIVEVNKGETITVYNDSKIEAEPIIKVYATASEVNCGFTINNKNYSFGGHPKKEFIIDSELMYLYREENGIVENYNAYYKSDDFPMLKHGENIIKINSNINKIEINTNINYL